MALPPIKSHPEDEDYPDEVAEEHEARASEYERDAEQYEVGGEG